MYTNLKSEQIHITHHAINQLKNRGKVKTDETAKEQILDMYNHSVKLEPYRKFIIENTIKYNFNPVNYYYVDGWIIVKSLNNVILTLYEGKLKGKFKPISNKKNK